MGSFSLWHWLIVLVVIGLPLFFVFRSPPSGPNRFGEAPPALSFGQAISTFFRKYAQFDGRASRSEFWFSFLFLVLVSVLLNLVDPTEALSGLFGLGVLLPGIALSARRLHDLNRSGWHQLLSYLFPIGSIVLIVWYCTAGSDQTAPVASSDGAMSFNSIEVLEKLAKLKDSGAISGEEYEKEKRKILG